MNRRPTYPGTGDTRLGRWLRRRWDDIPFDTQTDFIGYFVVVLVLVGGILAWIAAVSL